MTANTDGNANSGSLIESLEEAPDRRGEPTAPEKRETIPPPRPGGGHATDSIIDIEEAEFETTPPVAPILDALRDSPNRVNSIQEYNQMNHKEVIASLKEKSNLGQSIRKIIYNLLNDLFDFFYFRKFIEDLKFI
jgi:hypothetical protein